ncbi:MAG: PH domain-containing protein [Candidatus Latescibacterota bacterium]|nr:MAG: PH domain-containing protein [Candidatus Latescibacterota bacterium]
MKGRVLRPNASYATKLGFMVTLIAVLIGIGCILMAWLISLDEGRHAGIVVAQVLLSINAAWWIVGMLLVRPYYRSLSYQIENDEVIVRVGIFVKSVKHVPYRTVTNITTKRDPLDRWFFGLGTLNIQTAGMSGNKGAEEKLVGLSNVQEVYETVADELRSFRGAMTPTAAEVETEPSRDSLRVLGQILEEVRGIRRETNT